MNWKIDTKVKKMFGYENVDIVCPRCCNLAKEAVNTLFPNGYKSEIVRVWMKRKVNWCKT